RRAEPLQNPTLAIDGDDRHEREDRAERDENGREYRHLQPHEAAPPGRAGLELPPEDAPHQQEEQHGNANRTNDTHWLAREDLDFQPGEFPESSQHSINPG